MWRQGLRGGDEHEVIEWGLNAVRLLALWKRHSDCPSPPNGDAMGRCPAASQEESASEDLSLLVPWFGLARPQNYEKVSFFAHPAQSM